MTWDEFIKKESEYEYYKNIMSKLDDEYKSYKCHPARDDIFNAYKFTAYDDVKCVIIGQDPYMNDGEAHGLAFSVYDRHLTPSLKNIFKEMSSDLNVEINQDGNLEYLTGEGVFLLNSILSVRDGKAMSHKSLGWEEFTDRTIKKLNEREKPMVFILWGAPAQKKEALITNSRHLVIKSAHPSPLGAYRGFWGSKPFSKCNDFLKENGIEPIKWYKEEKTLFNL